MIIVSQCLRTLAHKIAFISPIEKTLNELKETLKETERITGKFKKIAPRSVGDFARKLQELSKAEEKLREEVTNVPA